MFLFYKIGSFPLTVLLNNNSAGRTPVVECGVVRYCSRNLLSSCCHDRFSAFAVLSVLPSGCINRSASALPWGQRGVENFGVTPSAAKYREYSSPLKGGPLSVFTVLGMPCVANILSSFGMTTEAFVDFTISTSGKREYLSTISHGPVGMSVIASGSGVVCFPTAWHGRHRSRVHFTILSMFGNQTFSRKRAFVLESPGCVSWARSIALCCRDSGITILDPRRIRPLLVMVSSSLMFLNGFTTS